MNRKYLLRKNFKAVYSQPEQTIVGHLAFKTKDDLWLDTPFPTLVLISVQSAFHEGREGFLKMEAFLSIIRESVQGIVTVLIADTAHLQACRLLEGEGALSRCLMAADQLVLCYKDYFSGCDLLYWHTLQKEGDYLLLKGQISALARSDDQFNALLLEDAQSTWTKTRETQYGDRLQFIENTVADLIDQCTCLQLLARRGYRYLFYPGAPYKAGLYLDALLPFHLNWVDVFLTIEKKSIRNLDRLQPVFQVRG